jgi:hypothetical protein
VSIATRRNLGGAAMFIFPRRAAGVFAAFAVLYLMLNVPWVG